RNGGVARRLAAPIVNSRGASWGDNGLILYAPSSHSGIFSISLRDSTPRPITTLDSSRGEIGHMWPQALPGGKEFLYFVASNDPSVRGIYVGSIGAPHGNRIVGSPAAGMVSAGYLLYVDDSALVARRFDLRTKTLADGFHVIGNVATSLEYYAAFSASRDVLVYVEGAISHLVWMDSTGLEHDTASAWGYVRNPILSPDGRFLAYEAYRQTDDSIRYTDLTSNQSQTVPRLGSQATGPVWSPTKRTLAYVVAKSHEWDLYTSDVSRPGEQKLRWKAPHEILITDWLDRDQTLILTERTDGGDFDVVSRRLSDMATPTLLAGGPANQMSGRVSPDGRFLAFVSYPSVGAPQPEVYVTTYPRVGPFCPVSSNGGWQPVWGPARRELYYLSPGGALMKVVAPIDNTGACSVPAPRLVFGTAIADPGTSLTHYAIAKDGRILVNQPRRNSAWLTVISNWLAPPASGR
ncbi:MAG TPA: hypothetical protein VKR27_05625, partial [Acidimicrobiales bacterium]|nr:hypothetical protein [Acidimicrobiales bacterium]